MHYLIVLVVAFALSVMGCEGKTGPAGPQGQTGQTGDRGPAGPAGQDGAPGPKGDTGDRGPAGPKGDTGETGPAGADGAQGPKGDKGDTGEMGPPGDASTIDPSDLGDLLADVHHIKLIQDGDDKDATVVYAAHDDFAMGTPGGKWDTTLDVGETTMIVAKAATQTAEPIPGVAFGWSSKNEEAVTVDGGMIEAVGTGSSEITATAMGRGIAVKFTVTVLSEVKSVVITSPGSPFYLSVDESVDLEATARDAAQDDKKSGIEGDEVPVALTFMSNNEDVISIDGNTATAEGVGEAKITAHYGDVASKAIEIKVTPGGSTTHLITFRVIDSDDRAFHIVWGADSTTAAIYAPGDERGDAANTDGAAGGTVVFNVTVNEYDSEGNYAPDTDVSAGLTVKLQQSGDVLDDEGITVALTSGEGTVTITAAADGGLDSKALVGSSGNAVVGAGISRIILSYPGADDRVLPAVTVTEETEAPADGS